ncbi:MAG TPA: hypothetical protein VGH91_07485 [Gammaproteobacteria bacterium]|jgi:hypothetical protein
MKLIHTSTHSAVESRLERLAYGRRRLQRRSSAPAPSDSLRGTPTNPKAA